MLERWTDAIDRWQRRRSWSAYPFAVIKKFGDDHAGNLAALVAYYSFFSIFPLLLVFTAILGRVLPAHPELRDDLLDSALANFPLLGDQIRDNLGGLPSGGMAFVVGLAGALWAGMGAVIAMQNALNGVWNVPYKHRSNMLAGRLRALAMLVVFGVGVLAVTVAGSVTQAVTDQPAIGSILAFLVALVLGFLLFLSAFKLLTDARVAWSDLVPGAIVAAIAGAALQVLGGAFVRHWVQGASATSGVFAMVIGLLSWLYLLAQVTVLSAEINVVRREHLWPRSLTGHDLTDGDQRALARYAAVEQRIEGQEVLVDLHAPAVGNWVRTQAQADRAD